MGYLKGRVGGWPHYFAGAEKPTPEEVKTSQYYDAVNFAKYIKVPGYYAYGYNDPTTPPTSVAATINAILAPKTIDLAYDMGHWKYNETVIAADEWLAKKLLE